MFGLILREIACGVGVCHPRRVPVDVKEVGARGQSLEVGVSRRGCLGRAKGSSAGPLLIGPGL